MKNIFKQTISNIKDLVGENYIWVSYDETTDSLGRHPITVVICILSRTDQIPPLLLKVLFLDKINAETITSLFIYSIMLLWPDGIKYDKVLLYISDAALCMEKSYKSLKLTFPKVLNVNCMAHNIHHLCETIRNIAPLADK